MQVAIFSSPYQAKVHEAAPTGGARIRIEPDSEECELTDAVQPRQSLGIGGILSDTIAIFFSRFSSLALVSAGPLIALTLPLYILFGQEVRSQGPSGTATSITVELPGGVAFFSLVLNTIVLGFVIAMVVQIAYDAKVGRLPRLQAYAANTISQIVPIVATSVIIAIAVSIGVFLFLIPGFYVHALWCVAVPAIVVERVGFGGLERSRALTKYYRWPIVGAYILVGLMLVLASFLLLFLAVSLANLLSLYAATLVTTFLNAMAYAFYGVMVGLIYARLREIKDGVSAGSLADVFA